MSIRSALSPALFFAAMAATPAVVAQEVGTAEPALQQPLQQQGQPTVVATHRDWEVLCIDDENGIQNCEMYQLLTDGSDQPVAEISIAALPFGSDFAAGATVTTPLETFLPFGMGFFIGDPPGEGDEIRVEGFRVCTVVGCIVRMGLSPEEINQMKAGATATAVIAPFVAIDQPVEITISLAGFTAAYDELQTRLAEAAARARELQDQ
jgi:invasion protein IalB